MVTINQLILARELRSPRELQMELQSAEEYQESVKEETEGPGIPEQPAPFLHALVRDTVEEVLDLESIAEDCPNEGLSSAIGDLTSNLSTDLEATLDDLDRSRGGVFSALLTILDADFAARLNHARWIRKTYESELSATEGEQLDDIGQRIEQLDIARQYFKTIYIKQELVDLSKLVMYTGFVAVLFSLTAIIVAGYVQTPFSPSPSGSISSHSPSSFHTSFASRPWPIGRPRSLPSSRPASRPMYRRWLRNPVESG